MALNLKLHEQYGKLDYEQVDQNWNDIQNETASLQGQIDLLAGSGLTASAITITDSGDYYTSTDVEGALQEVGASLAAIGTNIGDIGTALDIINGEVI